MIIFSLSDWSLCDIQLFITDRLLPACLLYCLYLGRVDIFPFAGLVPNIRRLVYDVVLCPFACCFYPHLFSI